MAKRKADGIGEMIPFIGNLLIKKRKQKEKGGKIYNIGLTKKKGK